MALYDRDYYQERPRGLQFHVRSVVTILIALNVLIWLLQVAFIRQSDRIEEYLAANPRDIFERLYLWQVLTANFLHSPHRIGHILGNMLFLFFFGRELETIYGRRNYLIFYLLSGAVAIFAEAAFAYSLGNPAAVIMGASGAVMGTVVLFTLLFPTREIYLGMLVPIQVWLLCVLYVLFDLYGALNTVAGGGSQVAFFAHLAGALVGLLYWRIDLRWDALRSRFFKLTRSLRGRRSPRIVYRRPRPLERDRGPALLRRAPGEEDAVSRRIDQLLEKISQSGRESLTAEEMEFLQQNSRRYRSGS